MLAVQIAGEMPGRREDALFVLESVRKILDNHVFNDDDARIREDAKRERN